jgi:TMEM199 family protein
MVYITMTPAMVAALEAICRLELKLVNDDDDGWEYPLNNPVVGNPIGHSQVIAISKLLRIHNHLQLGELLSYHLDDLLRGSRIFKKPPKPKQEPVRRIMCFHRARLLMISSRRLAIRL